MRPMKLSRAFTLIEPGPVVLVTTSDGGSNNVMTISWTMVVDFIPRFAITTGAWNHSFKALEKTGVPSEAIHGNKSQNARQRALDAFSRGRARVLVATDLAARGIDVQGVTHVINYELPAEAESYVHRIGRTARAGASGIALSFCDGSERGQLKSIERLTNQRLAVLQVPANEDMPVVAQQPAQREEAPREERGQRRSHRPYGQRDGHREGHRGSDHRGQESRGQRGPDRGHGGHHHRRNDAPRQDNNAPRQDGDRQWVQGDYRDQAPREERPHREHHRHGDRPHGHRPQADRPRGDRPYGDRPHGHRSQADRPRSDRPYSDRPQADRPHGERPYGDRPQGDRPQTQDARPQWRKRRFGGRGRAA